jgi:hypothetical protein
MRCDRGSGTDANCGHGNAKLAPPTIAAAHSSNDIVSALHCERTHQTPAFHDLQP